MTFEFDSLNDICRRDAEKSQTRVICRDNELTVVDESYASNFASRAVSTSAISTVDPLLKVQVTAL